MKLPEILRSEVIARSRFFNVEELHLRFSNGEERVYERLPQRIGRAVIVCAINEHDEVLLIREYMAGIHAYELGLPKGRVESNESFEEAANRELMEEVGYGAKKLTYMREITVAPGQMGYSVHLVLAEDLYPQHIEGDEPEPLEVVAKPLQSVPELLASRELSEGRSLAAIALVWSSKAGLGKDLSQAD